MPATRPATWKVTCPKCRGTGAHPAGDCWPCGGTGKVTAMSAAEKARRAADAAWWTEAENRVNDLRHLARRHLQGQGVRGDALRDTWRALGFAGLGLPSSGLR